MTSELSRFVNDEAGATAIEYGLIAAMIAVAIIAALTVFGGSVQGLFVHVANRAGNAMNNSSI